MIEHPSMSVYQIRHGISGAEEEEVSSDEDEDSPPRLLFTH